VDQITSAAAQIIVSLIPIVGIVMGAVVVFFYFLWNHRRQILLIKAGQFNKPDFDLVSFSLLSGLLLSSVGIVMTVFLIIAAIPIQDSDSFMGLLGGIIPLTMGIGLLAFYGIKRGDRTR